MKHAKLLGCLLMVVAGSAQLRADPFAEEMQIVPIAQLNQISQNLFDDKSLVLECTEGSILPFKISVKGEFLALESEGVPLYLTVLKTCYIRSEGEGNFLFSEDLETWKGFSEFFSGYIGVSAVADEEGPVATLNLELSRSEK